MIPTPSNALRPLLRTLGAAGLLLWNASPIAAATGPTAFPGAEGAGAMARGGRGGQVLFVINLLDYRPGKDEPVPGSLRAAIETPGPRTILFRTGGTIALVASLRVTEAFLTLAGQSAPGDGICLTNFDLSVRDTHDVIIRHLRARPGDSSGKELDGISIYESRDVILDHCSASWSSDETLSVTGAVCDRITIQWCFITESLNRSVHDKGEHGYGSLIRAAGEISYHHNLYAHHKTRCPRPGTYGDPPGLRFDFRNNVIYNWVSPAGYSSEDPVAMNYVGNFLKPGPSTTSRDHIFNVGGEKTTALHLEGNFLDGAAADPDGGWKWISNPDRARRLDEALPLAAVETHSAARAHELVLEQAGAILPVRDAIDARIVREVTLGEGAIIDTPADAGGWPAYDPGTAPPDCDDDGMPDYWEKSRGLDANTFDANEDPDGDGYTNLEEFLNRPILPAEKR